MESLQRQAQQTLLSKGDICLLFYLIIFAYHLDTWDTGQVKRSWTPNNHALTSEEIFLGNGAGTAGSSTGLGGC